ncbi:alpha-ribazole phosphatase [Zhouia amylolytica]|uniref:Alpha-ribazole phosphatase n=1 Tax=Zhouia amylolytica AD3 TaxID=1286632 RepID=W2URK4_9FLAO|nr:alpha-ribazole phosphatase [Zhouia amylolytica]ETN95947.1 phosphoglycerate mutase [Zhouia amylolytica AD3]
MEIYLIRHTTPKIEKGTCYGQADIDLDENYLTELKKIKDQLPKNYKSFKLYTSPLKRCSILAEDLMQPIILENRLKELNFGTWELKKWNDIENNELNPWMDDFVNVKVPNGESYIDLQRRSLEFLEELLSSKKNSIVVSHAGVIRVILSHINQIPLEDSFKIKIDYGAVFKIIYAQNRLEIN